jgi:hypothetical protein
VRNPERLRHVLSTLQHERDEAYRMTIEFPGGSVYDSVRVMRSRASWRYVGVTHEVLVRPGGNPDVPRLKGTSIIHHADSSSNAEENKKRRYEKDVELLQAEIDAGRGEPRTYFYLGLSHMWTGNNMMAVRTLEKRIAMGGWKEEVFIAKLNMARAAARLGMPWDKCHSLYLSAASLMPERAEPFADLAKHYADAEDHLLCVTYARAAFELPLPGDGHGLFIEKSVYDWYAADMLATHAYYLPPGVGFEELGLRAARKAAAHGPEEHKSRLLRNLALSIARVAVARAAGKSGA